MKIGLIGNNISSSNAPDIHIRLAKIFQFPLEYLLFDLKDKEENYFVVLLEELRVAGFKGVNITFPFKEKVIKHVENISKNSRNVGSANTLIFKKKITAQNTDYTGFLKTYNFHFGKNTPGTILVLGAGGVSRAVTFALAFLGVEKIFLIDKDEIKAKSLSKDLSILNINCVVTKPDQIEKNLSSFNGIINCTPVGHYDFPGCPLGNLMPNKKQWIFDVVYTPAKTNFIKKGEQVGVKIISGIDLFIFQAIDAFLYFTEKKDNNHDLTNHIHKLRKHYFDKLYI